MQFRRLGESGLKVPALSFGSGTFGGSTEYFKAWGSTAARGARELIDVCMDHGVTLFDTANSYSAGRSEEILGEALRGRRDRALISTKATIPWGPGPNDGGSSRLELIRACEGSLSRLGTDYIDIYFMHTFDGTTPVEEVMGALHDLVASGKVRYIGCSNFLGWQLMKSQAVAEMRGLTRYVSHQVCYSLAVREFEHELRPLAVDQGVGTMVWSPLAEGALTGKFRRGERIPDGTRLAAGRSRQLAPRERIDRIVDALVDVGEQVDATPAQVALAWVLSRDTVSTAIIGARDHGQLVENLEATNVSLTAEQIALLDEVSAIQPAYPLAHQLQFPQFAPKAWHKWRSTE